MRDVAVEIQVADSEPGQLGQPHATVDQGAQDAVSRRFSNVLPLQAASRAYKVRLGDQPHRLFGYAPSAPRRQ